MWQCFRFKPNGYQELIMLIREKEFVTSLRIWKCAALNLTAQCGCSFLFYHLL